MKTHKVLLLTLIVSAALSVSAQAGNHHENNNGSQVAPARARSSAPTFHSTSGARFGGGGMITRSQRFSSIGPRSTPASFRQRYINSGGGVAPLGQRQFTPRTLSDGSRLARFENNRTRDFGLVRNNRENRVAEIQNHN